MRQYAESRGCRRAFILNYFGEASGPVCGTCDNCDAGAAAAASPAAEPFPVGSHVTHATWGAGQVVRYEGETVTVLFEGAGYHTLSLDIVRAERLLEPAESVHEHLDKAG
jgi:ATP-dependent DNA helicase RecQ